MFFESKFFSEEPDAVFLQEVVSISLEILRQNLNEYEFHSGQFAKSSPDYFVVILTRRDRFRINKNINYPFPNSRMNRNLFNVEVKRKIDSIVSDRRVFLRFLDDLRRFNSHRFVHFAF